MQRGSHVHFSDQTHHVADSPLLLAFDHVTKFYGAVIGVNNISLPHRAGDHRPVGRQRSRQEHAHQAGQRAVAAQPGPRAHRQSRRLEHGRQASPGLQSRHQQLLRGDDRPRVRLRHGPAAWLFARRGPRADRARAGRSRHGGPRQSPSGRLQPRHAAADQAGPGAGTRSVAAVARRAADGHRSGRTPRNQRAVVPPGRPRQDDPRLEPHPGRDRAVGPFDPDDVARAVDRLGHACRGAQT